MNTTQQDANGIIRTLQTRADFLEAKVVRDDDGSPYVQFALYTPLGPLPLIAHRLPNRLRIYGLEDYPLGQGRPDRALQIAAMLTLKLAGVGQFRVNSADGKIHYIAHHFLSRDVVPKLLLTFALNEAVAADSLAKHAFKEIALEKVKAHRNELLAEHIFAKQPLADPVRN